MYKTLPVDLDYFTYTRILEEMCNVILRHIFNCSEGFKMPYGLGFIQIGKYKPKTFTAKSLSIDYIGLKYLEHFLIDIDINCV